ncbi:hypothetical protein C8R45DRAFT_932525 [Mycena sanguinolenta]|nr:hypothetical protein C8R45DRAFT_932525 [Mycena sanguinolenta]
MVTRTRWTLADSDLNSHGTPLVGNRQPLQFLNEPVIISRLISDYPSLSHLVFARPQKITSAQSPGGAARNPMYMDDITACNGRTTKRERNFQWSTEKQGRLRDDQKDESVGIRPLSHVKYLILIFPKARVRLEAVLIYATRNAKGRNAQNFVTPKVLIERPTDFKHWMYIAIDFGHLRLAFRFQCDEYGAPGTEQFVYVHNVKTSLKRGDGTQTRRLTSGGVLMINFPQVSLRSPQGNRHFAIPGPTIAYLLAA